MRLVVYSLTGCLLCSTAVAKYCVKLPTCEELGYIYSADKYPNNRSIKCPFDTKKILLLDYCQAYGLTSCDSTSGECDECIVEKADGTKSNSGYWRYTRCNAGYSYKSGECPPTEVNREQYPHEGSEGMDESIGEIECVQSAQNIYCGYKSCNEGWNLNSGNCIVHDCGSSYPYTSCGVNGTCEECKSGANIKYSAPTCNLGWYTSGVNCVENDCTGFTSASSTIANCTTISSCQKGANTVYKCDVCATDYELIDGYCVQNCAYTATSLPTNCSVADSCSKNGKTYYSSTCQTCKDGYTVSSGSCKANTCSGYGSSSSGCASYTTCKSGTTTKYKCTKCNSCYSLSNNQCKNQNTCSSLYLGQRTSGAYTDAECDSLYNNGSDASTCKKCGTTYYACYCAMCNPFE